MAALAVAIGCAVPSARAYEGFGASTPGGTGGSTVRVTTLESSGHGSLRAALSEGHRVVVFDVAGDIHLDDHLYVKGPYVTIDGFSAPAPGITLRNRGLIIRGSENAHDVVVRGIRVRDATIDGIQVGFGAYNVVIDHVSVSGAGDGNIDITDSSDVTVSWSILAASRGNHSMLVKYDPARVSLHHNLFADSRRQNPDVALDAFMSPASDVTVDMRNNLIWNWGYGIGTKVHLSARANVVGNLYANPGATVDDQERAIVVCTVNCDEPPSYTRAHVSSNVSADPPAFSINNALTDAAPFPAPPVATEDACLAARRILGEAGVRPLDGTDEATIAAITLPWCPAIFVKGLAHEAVRRNASDAEVQDWLSILGPRPSAWDVWTLVRAVFESGEARAQAITPQGYIAAAYRAAHGRPPDGETLDLYTGQLLDRWHAMIPPLLASPEYAATEASGPPGALVGRLYREALGRTPSASESNGWTEYLMSTGDASGVARGFFTSAEYTARPRTLEEHVNVVYRSILGRSPDAAEAAGWVDYLATRLGTLSPRGEDVAAFVDRAARLFP
jgi:pectate lyase